WDDKTYGALVMLSQLTTNPVYRTEAERWLDFWTVGRSGQRITYTPGGVGWVGSWGSLRYACNTAFLAMVYSDRVRDYSNRYRDFAVSQINYALGSNPSNRSYVCGFGNNPPTKPHHRGAHGSWNNQINNPVGSRHILTGALVGGPGSNDAYTDARDNFTTNEVSCDYNAGFTGALARMYELYGGYTDPAMPQAETPDPQFFVEASVNSSASNYTEIRALLNNRSAFPARASNALRYRYFVDLSELYAAGGSKTSVTLTTNMLDGGTISGLLPWDEARHLYYVELRYDGATVIPGGSTSYRREAQFRLAVPSALGASAWNPTNDFSYSGLLAGNNNTQRSVLIPVYEKGVLLEGTEPTLVGTYGSWRETVFTAGQRADSAISGIAADPDGDGFANLMEYALGGNPLSPDPGLAPAAVRVGGFLRFDYRRPVAVNDLVYQVQWSDTLTDGAWSSAGVGEEILSQISGIRTVRASVPVAPTGPRRFARLNVVVSP
ncbi:MAG: glycoside hydrolase family 9 protein, partial [Microbacteriaceae bacterium]|nr:glycoside hydrolase family 9 protein [Microbacteriaceae bacterium]